MSINKDSMKIMEALSGVDGELLERSESEKKDAGRKRRTANRLWISLGSCAAAVCFTAAGVAGWRGIQISKEAQQRQEFFSPNPMMMSDADVRGDEIQTQTDKKILPEGQAQAYDDILPEGQAKPDEKILSGEADEVGTQNGTSEQEQSGTVEQARSKEGEDASKREVDAGADDKKDSLFADMEISSMPLNNAEKLTEEQARQLEVLGAYVPNAPKGYAFQEARLYQEGNESSLSISWAKGMDSIRMSIGIVDEEETAVVDVSRPECYDQRLYEIPYSDSVPEEYRETVNHPVFAAEDLSLDVVKSRVLNRGVDLGDTDTPRGDFYVLYPGGVQVRFNGKATPEQVWEMLSPLGSLTTPAP